MGVHDLQRYPLKLCQLNSRMQKNINVFYKSMFDSHGYPWNIYRIKTMKDTAPFLTRKVFLFLIISPSLLISKKCASFFCRETANENKHLKKTKTWISNSYFIRQSFWGFRCKSTLTIFAYKVTWNYTFIFFKLP